jgi:glycosyltransferase involved in cell wall biosynthesis
VSLSRGRSTSPTACARRPVTRSSESARGLRIVVVGAGTRFLSGISYYTIRLANALAENYHAGVITMRQILPTRLYPGRDRVGATLTRLDFEPAVRKLAPVDWYWLPSMVRAIVALIRFRPDVVIFQWWTGTVLHTYLALAVVARALGAKVVVEFHEILDTGEERIPFARYYVKLVGPLFVGIGAGFVIHSEADREPLLRRYRLGRRPCMVIPHGPYDHHVATPLDGREVRVRPVPSHVANLLFFGVIRPFKGLEDLVEAFDGLSDQEVQGYWLTVVGETWEGWDLPIRLIEASRHRARITLVNRYVDDVEVTQFFADADAVVLPYHRSSASGPAHVAMSHRLPLVITAVGGLPAAVEGYEGAVLIPPRDPIALREAIRSIPDMAGRSFSDPHSWQRTAALYGELFAQLYARSERR